MRTALCLIISCCFAPSAVAAPPAPDAIFVNGNIYTGNDKQPHAEAVAAKGDRITFVGSSADARKQASQTTRIVDLAEKTVLPGLTDSHCHIFGVGEREMRLNLAGTKTRKEFLAKVKEVAPDKWITGCGWIETFWQPPEFPTAADLDAVAPHNPVFLTRADGHAAIANSAALHIAGITAETPNPFGGEILREKTTGAPNGVLLDHAKELVVKHIPPLTAAEKEQSLLLGAKRSMELGWCEIQNPGSDTIEVKIMQRLFEAGRIKLRIYNAVSGPSEPADRLLAEGLLVGAYGGRFTQRAIKCYADGALGSRSAPPCSRSMRTRTRRVF